MKSDRTLYSIYTDIESLIKKQMDVQTIQKNSSTKISEHIPSRYSMSAILAFDNVENKHTLYLGEDCKEKFFTSFRENATNVIHFEKNKMLQLTKKS